MIAVWSDTVPADERPGLRAAAAGLLHAVADDTAVWMADVVRPAHASVESPDAVLAPVAGSLTPATPGGLP